jgi:hypothetical protein
MGKEKHREIGKYSKRKLCDDKKLIYKLPQEMEGKDMN